MHSSSVDIVHIIAYFFLFVVFLLILHFVPMLYHHFILTLMLVG